MYEIEEAGESLAYQENIDVIALESQSQLNQDLNPNHSSSLGLPDRDNSQEINSLLKER